MRLEWNKNYLVNVQLEITSVLTRWKEGKKQCRYNGIRTLGTETTLGRRIHGSSRRVSDKGWRAPHKRALRALMTLIKRGGLSSSLWPAVQWRLGMAWIIPAGLCGCRFYTLLLLGIRKTCLLHGSSQGLKLFPSPGGDLLTTPVIVGHVLHTWLSSCGWIDENIISR